MRKSIFCTILYYPEVPKSDHFTRQSRDKHRENSKRELRVLAGQPVVVAYSLDPLTLAPSSLRAQCFGEASPLELAASQTEDDFELWHFAPALGQSGWALLG